jgi:cobalt-zinc-cadmium efflux system protein
LATVQQALADVHGVADVHDLHVWAMGTSDVALTAHLELADTAADASAVLVAAEHALRTRFDIRHTTLQLETPPHAQACPQRGCGVA